VLGSTDALGSSSVDNAVWSSSRSPC
jgi:hypothetical protein